MNRVLKCSGLLWVPVVVMLLPQLVFAVGFGDIRLYSHLHQPLNAKIELMGIEQYPSEKVSVNLASSRDFLRAGIERPYFLTQLKFNLKREGDNTYVKVTSKHPIHDPSIELLVDLKWPEGRMVKAYTLLIEPHTVRPETRFSTSVQPDKEELQSGDETKILEESTPMETAPQETKEIERSNDKPALQPTDITNESTSTESTSTESTSVTHVESTPEADTATEQTLKETVLAPESEADKKPSTSKPIWQRFLSEIVLSSLMIIISIYMGVKLYLNRRIMQQAGRFKTTTEALAQARSMESSKKSQVNPMSEIAESVPDEVDTSQAGHLEIEAIKKLQATKKVDELEEDKQPKKVSHEMPEEASESSFEPGTTLENTIKSEEGEVNFQSSALRMDAHWGEEEEYKTKIKLAKQYLAAGDPQTARDELEEVMKNTTGAAHKEAQEILNKIL